MQDNAIYNVGIYARLSRDDERTGESVSIENQKELLGRYVREQGWNLIDYYVDDGVSGTTFDRPGLNRLIGDVTAGKVNLVLCKDLSRWGRDYIECGKYTDYIFPSLGCRFIALNDGVDTLRKNNEMVMILKNVMNDLYARDTSSKIRAVKKSTFLFGKYIGCYAPMGYQKSPEDKHVLIPDPVTAPIVKRIFDLRCQGFSYRKIATMLNEEGLPTPRDYYYMSQGKQNPRSDGGFWQAQTIKAILRSEVYLGHTVQNKTGNVSYKVHKQVPKPTDEWIRVENTHEPLITQDVWEQVRRMDEQNMRNRTKKDGTTALFAGLLYCMDCGSPMRHCHESRKHKDGSESPYHSYICNRYGCGGKTACSAHVLNQRVITNIVLLDIQLKAMWAQNNPEDLKEKIRQQKHAADAEQIRSQKAMLSSIEKRLSELDRLIQCTYEDKVKGAIPETVCVQLMHKYEDERLEKLEQKAELGAKIEALEQAESGAGEWISMIQDYSHLETLDRPTLLRLINRIEVGERKMVNGQDEREIKIYYNFVGYVEA
ncbi:MAG: recombinase family protein [Clostridiales bacterium]|nr:recombinase family protein [Clostridiales bacterium]